MMISIRRLFLFTALFLVFGAIYSSADTFPANGIITGERVNLRAGNSLKYEILRTFNTGARVTVLKLKGEYYLLKCPAGVPVWIFAKLVTIHGSTAIVTGKNVNIRAKAKTGTVVCQVSRPTKLKVLQKQKDWIRIEAPSNAKVYIHKKYVKLVKKTSRTDSPKLSPKPTPKNSPKPTPKKTAQPSSEWKEKFVKAEEAFDKQRAMSILESDFASVAKLYREILNSTKAAKYHEAAKQKIALCNFYVKQQAAYKDLKDKNKELEKRLEELKKELEEKLRKIAEEREKNKKSKEEEQFLATGTISSMGGIINRPATHRLCKGEEVIYLLKSKTINLDDYWGKYVGVKGTISPPPKGWKHNIITVTEVKVLSDTKRRPKPKR